MSISNIFWQRLLFILIAIILIDPCSSARRKYVLNGNQRQGTMSSDGSRSTRPKKLRILTPSSTFDPIEMDFPDIVRTGQAAIDYANEMKGKLPKGAIDPNLIMTGESCARGRGNIYNTIRFDVQQNQNITVYWTCYDEISSSAIFSSHKLIRDNKTAEHSEHSKFRPRYTLYKKGIDGYYKAKKHTTIFNATFHTPFTNENTTLRDYFSRNHLTPHADFPLIIDQWLTYYFHNCIPGYQSVNSDNVGKVEEVVRQLSKRLGVPLTIYTGVYGILQKWDKSNTQLLDVYLDMVGSRIEVPLVIWKLVINEATGESVAFFTSNDAKLTTEEIRHFKTICQSDKCDELGFKFKQEPASGITVCCTYEDFVRHIQFLPVTLSGNCGLLGAKRSSKWASKPAQCVLKAWTSVIQFIARAKKLTEKPKTPIPSEPTTAFFPPNPIRT